MSEPKRYYVDLEDGFLEGDIYLHKDEVYEVIRIDACNQIMEVEEIEDGHTETSRSTGEPI